MHWHSFVVHYAIAFLSIVPLFWLAVLLRDENKIFWWGFAFSAVTGMLAAGVALLSGEFAQAVVQKQYPAKTVLVAEHETFAYWTVMIYAAVLLWILARYRKMQPQERWGAAVVLWVAFFLLLSTARLGGQIFHP